MAFLTEAEKKRLNQQIRKAEAGTSGEIVSVITQRSDDYTYIPLLWATLCALTLPGVYFLLQRWGAAGWYTSSQILALLHWVYLAQVALFFLLAMLFQWEPVKMLLIPRSVRHARAANNARAQFLSQHVHWTEHRAGILVFVSVAEHYVEILVDQALAGKVDDAYWQRSIEHFVAEVKAGNTAAGFERTIEDCRVQLWQHYPATKPEGQSLPDHLIEV